MTNLGPYRTPGNSLELVLDSSEKESLIKNVIARREVDIKGLLGILDDSGYECDDSNIFLRYNKTAPIFPNKVKLLENKFVALLGYDNSISLLVSGPYNYDIADLKRNLDAIKDIDLAYMGEFSQVVKKGSSRTLGYAYKGIVGTALSASLISGSILFEGVFIFTALLGIATGAYYIKNKLRPVSPKTIYAANSFSANARNYIFNEHALMELETEASQIRKDKKRHEVFMALDGKVSSETFFKELDFLKTTWYETDSRKSKKFEYHVPAVFGECNFDCCESIVGYPNVFSRDTTRIVIEAFQKTHKLSEEKFYSDLIKAINGLFA